MCFSLAILVVKIKFPRRAGDGENPRATAPERRGLVNIGAQCSHWRRADGWATGPIADASMGLPSTSPRPERSLGLERYFAPAAPTRPGLRSFHGPRVLASAAAFSRRAPRGGAGLRRRAVVLPRLLTGPGRFNPSAALTKSFQPPTPAETRKLEREIQPAAARIWSSQSPPWFSFEAAENRGLELEPGFPSPRGIRHRSRLIRRIARRPGDVPLRHDPDAQQRVDRRLLRGPRPRSRPHPRPRDRPPPA